MTFKNKQLVDAIALALLAGLGTVSMAHAQDQEGSDEEETLDELVVTGSRIRSQTVTAASPVIEIGEEQFSLTGTTRVEDLVNQYPQLNPAFDSQNNNPSTGYATVSLRNLGAQRTLTLVNGRRLPPGAAAELRDISIIPSALVQRVDLLTGGASAVYGSDAVAGVVNFILNTEFEGFNATAGYSAYQHKNDNTYMQGLQTARGFTFEDGDSGFDGIARDVAFSLGGTFADGLGSAVGWLTYRENDALFHGQRDYASCALNAAGTACGGSGTNAFGNFFLIQGSNVVQANINQTTGRWQRGFGPAYNYAPPNFYQRPDERYTAGTVVNFSVNEYFEPYLEAMLVNRKDSVQIAESGTFFAQELTLPCSSPLLGTACADVGLNPNGAPLTVYVGRRNVEGGPRRTDTEDNTYRVVVGAKGAINDNWSYDASFLFARTANDLQGFNDFLSSRISDALLGCPAGSFAGCLPYNVWRPGQVTAAAANALAGTSFNKTNTELRNFNAFVTGDTGWSINGEENVQLVAGVETRHEEFAFIADNDSNQGNFAGAGAAAPPVNGGTRVKEFYFESLLPVYAGDGFLSAFGAELGYRLSNYDLSGNANTYKIAFTADTEWVKFRGGYNRAIRAPSINNLLAPQNVTLFGGADPCAGSAPVFTREQCTRLGVTAAQYGNIPQSPAGQNNQLTGGNPNLEPEEADTYTLGFVVAPNNDMAFSLDYYDIRIEDTIAAIGSNTILEFCGRTGDPFLCSRVQRNPTTGDLWVGTTGRVVNLTDNFGELNTRGLDFSANYGFDALGGRFSTSLIANYVLEFESAPLPGVNDDATFTCEGRINPSCQLQDFRAIASASYIRDIYSFNLRLRHFGSLSYEDNDGVALTSDTLVAANGGIGSYNYIDVSASATFWGNTDFTVGINNIADKEPPLVGVDLALNANAPGGYDQTGRYIFARVGVKF